MSKRIFSTTGKHSKHWLMGAVAAAGLSVAAVGHDARATVVSYGVINAGGQGLNAYADFNLNAADSTIAVTLNNFSTATTSDTQEIYGIDFSVMSASGSPVSFTSGPTITGASGTEVTLVQDSTSGDYLINTASALNKTITSNTGLSKPWITSSSGAGEVALTVDTSKPNDMIIAAPPSDNNYGSAGGLRGTINFNPSLLSGATFTLSLGGLSSGDTIGNVTILYGTGPASTSTVPFNSGSPVPEPSVLAFLGIGAVGSLLMLRKKKI